MIKRLAQQRPIVIGAGVASPRCPLPRLASVHARRCAFDLLVDGEGLVEGQQRNRALLPSTPRSSWSSLRCPPLHWRSLTSPCPLPACPPSTPGVAPLTSDRWGLVSAGSGPDLLVVGGVVAAGSGHATPLSQIIPEPPRRLADVVLGACVAEPTSTGRPRRVPASPGSAWKAGHEFAKESSRLKIGESCF